MPRRSECISNCIYNECSCANSKQPGDKDSVEPAPAILASIFELLLCLVGQESLLFAVDLILARVEVGLVRLDSLGLHEELVTEDANEVDRDTLRIALVGHVNIGLSPNLRDNR